MGITNDPLTGASFYEIWGVVWLRYIFAMSFSLLLYDTLLTLDDEVRLIFSVFFPRLTARSQMRLVWPGPLSLPKLLYYINRYLSIVAAFYANYRQYHIYLAGEPER